MRRPSFPATLLCALLPLATIGVWVQSNASPFGNLFSNVKRIGFTSYRGHALLTYMHPPTPATAPTFATSPNGLAANSTVTPIINRAFARVFSVAHYPDARTVRRGWTIDLPYPILLIPTGTLTGLIFLLERKYRKRVHRHQNGLCPTCGYDLRATPAQCPECGLRA